MYLFIFINVTNTLIGSVIFFFAWNYALKLVIPTVNGVDFLASVSFILFIMWLRGCLKIVVSDG